MMNIHEIAEKLVHFCRLGKFEKAQQELFATSAIGLEPETAAFAEVETKGRDVFFEKGNSRPSIDTQTYGCTITDPMVTRNHIAFTLKMVILLEGTERCEMEELWVYRVKDGKIISEQPFL